MQPELNFHALVVRPAFWGVVAGLAVGLSFFVGSLPVVMETPDLSASRVFKALVIPPAVQVTVLVLSLSLAVHFTSGGWRRLGAICAAVALAMLANHVVVKALWKAQVATDVEQFSGSSKEQGLYGQWLQLAAGALLLVYYVNSDKLRRSTARLRAAQLDLQRGEHAVLESQLNVVRARIDPTFLSSSLEEVRRRYGLSVADAEALLDELIAFLQSSLPQAREHGSTLGREVDLVAAYLNLVARLGNERSDISVDVQPALRDEFFPPMVLLPLFASAPRRVRLRAREDGERLVIGVEGSSASNEPENAAIRNLRATLGAFFGPEVRVLSVPADGEARITIEYRRADAAIGREAA